MDCCINCGSDKVSEYSAEVSPFFLERAYAGSNPGAKLFNCLSCGFSFFWPRPKESDLARLYSGYRNKEYQEQRQRYESWYTPEVNASLGHDPQSLSTRKAQMATFLQKSLDLRNVCSVIDYGGDTGQFVSSLCVPEAYVYDPSGLELDRGVHRLSSLGEKKFDLIICCNVLEHVISPHQVLLNLRSLSHKHSHIYLEVPLDSPFDSMLCRLRCIFSPKRFLGRPLFQMSEHINYFTPKSLAKAVEYSGLVVHSKVVMPTPPLNIPTLLFYAGLS